MSKTNAIRLIEQAGLPFRCTSYDYDESDLSGMKAASEIGMPPNQVFKTLVARGDKDGILVFCIPVCCSLDLKLAAKASLNKSVEMIPVKDLLPLTGYIRGGCSPIGMKKLYPTYIDETAQLYDEIAVSAGIRGQQIILSPSDLIDYVNMTVCDLTVRKGI